MDAMEQFKHEVYRTTWPLEKKIAAVMFVELVAAGEPVSDVLKNLAEPLGVTTDMVMRNLVTPDAVH